MKNIEKAFVTLALFLFITAWLLSLYAYAGQNILVLNQRAQILNTTSNTIEKSTTVNSSSLTLPSTLETVPTSGSSASGTLKPAGRFIYPLASNSVSSKVEIKFEVPDSISVELYMRRVESSTEIYLGYSRAAATNVWSYYWDSTSTPNGSYYIIPYISNKYGRYAGTPVSISVSNQVQQSTAQVTQLKEQIATTEDSIASQETKLGETQDQINTLAAQKTGEISNDAKTILPPEKMPVVNKELDALSSKIMNNAEIFQKQELDKSKQEITTKANEVTDLIVNSSTDKPKTEEIKDKIGSLVSDSIGKLDQYFAEKQKLDQTQKELVVKDSDNDGLPDQEEIRLGTDPFSPDTDGDGFIDSSEVKLGYDPLSASPADKVVYQNPKETLTAVSETYKVEKVELVESPQNKAEKVLKIQGKAPANSFVTIYIYSTPTIVVTKADANGNWEYTLDKPLADGRHAVYASVTNNKGDIEKVSQSFDFAKAEDSIIKLLAPSKGNTESPVQNINRIFIIMIVIAVVLAIVFVVLVLGIYLSQHNK